MCPIDATHFMIAGGVEQGEHLEEGFAMSNLSFVIDVVEKTSTLVPPNKNCRIGQFMTTVHQAKPGSLITMMKD